MIVPDEAHRPDCLCYPIFVADIHVQPSVQGAYCGTGEAVSINMGSGPLRRHPLVDYCDAHHFVSVGNITSPLLKLHYVHVQGCRSLHSTPGARTRGRSRSSCPSKATRPRRQIYSVSKRKLVAVRQLPRCDLGLWHVNGAASESYVKVSFGAYLLELDLLGCIDDTRAKASAKDGALILKLQKASRAACCMGEAVSWLTLMWASSWLLCSCSSSQGCGRS